MLRSLCCLIALSSAAALWAQTLVVGNNTDCDLWARMQWYQYGPCWGSGEYTFLCVPIPANTTTPVSVPGRTFCAQVDFHCGEDCTGTPYIWKCQYAEGYHVEIECCPGGVFAIGDPTNANGIKIDYP